jgi:hypothetical protein
MTCLAAAIAMPNAYGNDRKISYEQLPDSAKSFIIKHFPDVKVKFVTVDDDDQDYEVKLTNGAEINFRSNGEWKNVEARKEVPATCIPASIKDYAAKNYSGKKIVKLEKESYGFEVKLSGLMETELKFDTNGNFLRVDR